MSLILRSSSGQVLSSRTGMREYALESTVQLHMSDGVLRLPTTSVDCLVDVGYPLL